MSFPLTRTPFVLCLQVEQGGLWLLGYRAGLLRSSSNVFTYRPSRAICLGLLIRTLSKQEAQIRGCLAGRRAVDSSSSSKLSKPSSSNSSRIRPCLSCACCRINVMPCTATRELNRGDLRLCTGGYDNTIRFWEAWSGICSRTIQHPESVSAYSDMKQLELTRAGHLERFQQVNRLAISPDKRHIAAAGNQTIKLYDITAQPQPGGNIPPVSMACSAR